MCYRAFLGMNNWGHYHEPANFDIDKKNSLTELPTKGVMSAQHIFSAMSLGWANPDFSLCLCKHAGFRAVFVIPDTHSITALYLGRTILSTFPLKYSTSCTGCVLWLLLQ